MISATAEIITWITEKVAFRANRVRLTARAQNLDYHAKQLLTLDVQISYEKPQQLDLVFAYSDENVGPDIRSLTCGLDPRFWSSSLFAWALPSVEGAIGNTLQIGSIP